MPTARSLLAGLALALTAISCSDQSTTAPNQNPASPTAPQFKPTALTTLSQSFTTTVTNTATGAVGTFTGTATITSFSTDAAGNLIAHGTLVGTITGGIVQTVSETFSQIVSPDPRRCQILHLDLGPIFLQLLGLEVSLNEIVLDVTAVSGPGNLLGNLLCALVHLLDQNPLDAAIAGLLAQINAILASL